MTQLHDDISGHLEDALTIAQRMVEIAEGDEWSAEAWQDFDSIVRNLDRALDILKDTPETPDAKEDDK